MKPIAMKCTQQDWEDIKPILEKNGLKILHPTNFNDIPYLVTNTRGVSGVIDNFSKYDKDRYNRTVYEQWDKNIFLEACDIKTKYSIEDLANGKCAVINDGTVDELNKVLQVAFPLVDKYQYPIQGINKYYHCIPHYKQDWTFTNGDIDLPTQSVKDFLKQEVKINMDNRFPFSLSPSDAQKIINIACSTWKDRLANIFSINIVLNKNIEISEEFYKEMRKACTADQHTLFNNIFGKDDVFKKDDLVVVTGITTYNYGSSSGSIKPIVGKTYKYLKYYNGLGVLEVDNLNKIAINNSDLRLATEEEVKAFNSYKYSDGELVFVKNNSTGNWGLRYTNGNIDIYNRIECYDGQKKSGVVSMWNIYKPAPGVKLPD